MTDTTQPGTGDRTPTPPAKRTYERPVLTVYGDLVASTTSLKNLKNADGHPGAGRSKTS